jgi:hypothetical protein
MAMHLGAAHVNHDALLATPVKEYKPSKTNGALVKRGEEADAPEPTEVPAIDDDPEGCPCGGHCEKGDIPPTS